jgi:preprotein translocase subunit YajC
MKIGDKVTYNVGGLVHYGVIVWIKDKTAVIQTDKGTRDEVDKEDLKLI